jgi:hypothetical protein
VALGISLMLSVPALPPELRAISEIDPLSTASERSAARVGTSAKET